MTTYREEIEAMRLANNEKYPLGYHSYRQSLDIAHFVRFDRPAAIIAARAALDEIRACVNAAWGAVQAEYAAGPAEGPNPRALPLFAEWRRLDADLRTMRRTCPPEGSICEHAARWLNDPTEENRARLALFVA